MSGIVVVIIRVIKRLEHWSDGRTGIEHGMENARRPDLSRGECAINLKY